MDERNMWGEKGAGERGREGQVGEQGGGVRGTFGKGLRGILFAVVLGVREVTLHNLALSDARQIDWLV